MDGCSPAIDISDDCGNKVAHDSRVARLSKRTNAPLGSHGSYVNIVDDKTLELLG